MPMASKAFFLSRRIPGPKPYTLNPNLPSQKRNRKKKFPKFAGAETLEPANPILPGTYYIPLGN